MGNNTIPNRDMGELAIKSIKKGPWLIDYELHGDKIVYLIWACKDLELFKCWNVETKS